MRIIIDTKNLALYNGGIAHWFSPLLEAWIKSRTDVSFILLGPEFDLEFLPQTGNWQHVPVHWPTWLPRPLRHPWYDNVLFPRAVVRLKPDLVMSPYHDVRMPKAIPSIITVHDLCFDELKAVYPSRIRSYYLRQLRYNLSLARFVLTVSESSRDKLTEYYSLQDEHIGVVYNTPPASFRDSCRSDAITDFKKRHYVDGRLLFYPGGPEYRKNVDRLISAFSQLIRSDESLVLLVTGNKDSRWDSLLANCSELLKTRIKFAGRLSDEDLRLGYLSADAVVYPSLCEGFGRVCLEAMVTGVPLACSNLPVMREVAGDYAHYCDPYSVDSIAKAVQAALNQERPSPVKDQRFVETEVINRFLKLMDSQLSE